MEELAETSGLSPSIMSRSFYVPLLARISRYVHTLSPGDRLIASVLGLCIIATSVAGLYALERSILIVEPAYGGTLTEGVVGSPRFVNPLLALTDTDRDLSALTYAGLMGIGGSDASGVRPVLAQGYTVSSDGKTYTFTLRSDAQFSDGTPVTADDVVFTVQKAQDPLLKSPLMADWANIKAEAVDARTIRFTLPKAYSPFLEDTTLGILPKHLWQNVSDQDFPFSTLQNMPVGAGPFTVTQIGRDNSGDISSYSLTVSKAYVLGRPYLDGMTFKFYRDTTTLTKALTSGSIESAYGIRPTGTTHRIVTAPYARIFGVFFNPAQDAIYSHIEVRKALSLAIDRPALVHDLLGGYGSVSTGPVPAGSGIPQASSTAMLAQAMSATDRVAAAKNVLSTNGWSFDESSGTWKKGSESLTVTLKTSNVPELKVLATAIRTDWQAIGVPVSLELSDPNALAQQVIGPRAYGALYFGEVVGRTEDLYAFWDSAEIATPGLNIADYSNKTVDTLLERIRTTDTPLQKLTDLADADARIALEYPAAFTHTPDFLYAIPKSLQGVQLVQIASPSDRFASVEQWYVRSEAVWPFVARKTTTN